MHVSHALSRKQPSATADRFERSDWLSRIDSSLELRKSTRDGGCSLSITHPTARSTTVFDVGVAGFPSA